MYFEDTVTCFDKTVMFTRREEANRYIEIYPAIIVLKRGLNALFIRPKSYITLYFVFICSAEDLFTLTSNKFRMVYQVDGSPQVYSRD